MSELPLPGLKSKNASQVLSPWDHPSNGGLRKSNEAGIDLMSWIKLPDLKGASLGIHTHGGAGCLEACAASNPISRSCSPGAAAKSANVASDGRLRPSSFPDATWHHCWSAWDKGFASTRRRSKRLSLRTFSGQKESSKKGKEGIFEASVDPLEVS